MKVKRTSLALRTRKAKKGVSPVCFGRASVGVLVVDGEVEQGTAQKSSSSLPVEMLSRRERCCPGRACLAKCDNEVSGLSANDAARLTLSVGLSATLWPV